MDPELPWLERRPNYNAEASCMLIVHVTRWKDVWVPCRDPTESPRPPLHLKTGITCLWQLESHVEFTTSNVDDNWQLFIIVRNANITVSNRKGDLNSHLTSRSVCIVLPRLVYIPELSLIPRQVSWLHWTNSSFEWTSPPCLENIHQVPAATRETNETSPSLQDEAQFPCISCWGVPWSQSKT